MARSAAIINSIKSIARHMHGQIQVHRLWAWAHTKPNFCTPDTAHTSPNSCADFHLSVWNQIRRRTMLVWPMLVLAGDMHPNSDRGQGHKNTPRLDLHNSF